MNALSTIRQDVRITQQDFNEDSAVPDESTKLKCVKFTPEQLEALDELAANGVFKPFGATKKSDPDAIYEYIDFSDMVRRLIADLYRETTGKEFPEDPLRGNPNFYES